MTTAIVGDDAETVLREEKHLSIPGIRVQRPAVREGHDRALAPVLVIDLRSIFGFDCAHMSCSFLFTFVLYCLGSKSSDTTILTFGMDRNGFQLADAGIILDAAKREGPWNDLSCDEDSGAELLGADTPLSECNWSGKQLRPYPRNRVEITDLNLPGSIKP